MKLISFVLLLFYMNECFAQPYQTGRRSVVYTDTSRSNRSIPAELFYPATTAGTNVPLAAGSSKFPLVVFGHGFVIPFSSYNWLADSLVKNGYIVAMPATEGSLSPDHLQFAKDLAFLCNYIIPLNDSPGNFLFGRVIKRSVAGGHSMGGGSSFLSTVNNPSLNAIFNLAAAETNPSAKAAASQCNLPALIFAGSADCIVPDSNQLRMYNNIPYPCKSFVNITGALHCQFANNNGTCASGQFLSGCNSSSVTTATVFAKTIALLVPFLDYYLKDSCSSKSIFENRLNTMAGITQQRICSTDPFVCSPPVSLYIFTGAGNWNIESNWNNGMIPPAILTTGTSIVINPSGSSACILNTTQTISAGASIVVAEGKQLIVQGSLIIQE